MIKKLIIDRFGVLAGSLCAFHCLLTAFLPSLFLVLGLNAFLSSDVEWIFSIVTIFLAFLSLVSVYRNQKSKMITFIFIVGITGVISSRLLEGQEHGEHKKNTHNLEHHAGHEHGTIDKHHEGVDNHLIGAIIGIGSGLTIAGGHFLSLRQSMCKKC